MKKNFLIFIFFTIFSIPLFATQKYFKVEGPEKKYNQIRIINETSYSNFQCRLVLLNKKADDEFVKKSVYGIYNLKAVNDTDICTSALKRGDYIGIEMENDFPGEVTFYIEYIDVPFFDIVVIHLRDAGTKFAEDYSSE